MNQNVETKNKQKTIADFLFKEAPEAAISGLYKGMESGVNAIAKGMEFGVGILSDYVENPVRNVTFDVATAGAGKFVTPISPKFFLYKTASNPCWGNGPAIDFKKEVSCPTFLSLSSKYLFK